MGGSMSAPPRFLSTSETARILSISPKTLRRWRHLGCGPPYRKLGELQSRAVYLDEELAEWMRRSVRFDGTVHEKKVRGLSGGYAGT